MREYDGQSHKRGEWGNLMAKATNREMLQGRKALFDSHSVGSWLCGKGNWVHHSVEMKDVWLGFASL
jgi:hypothetical protein